MIRRDDLQNMSGYKKSFPVSSLSQLSVEAVELAMGSHSSLQSHALFVMSS